MSQGGLLATIKQVASKAGVSVSTVSRYITHKGYVSAEAEVKIKKAIQDLNYSPNISAQSLKSKKVTWSVFYCRISLTLSFRCWRKVWKNF